MTSIAAPHPPRFDRALGAWILSTYADVTTALRDARLSIAGSIAGSTAESSAAHDAFRDAAGRALSSQRLADWRVAMDRAAVRIAAALPRSQPIDLVDDFARPWSTEVAAMISGVSLSEALRLAEPAREVFLSAAKATDSEPQPETHSAIDELSRALKGPNPALAVQTFVAVSQTLPCVLAGAWLALLQQSELMQEVRTTPVLASRAVDELLRLTSPTRAVFRTACADIRIGAANIVAGERVILMIAAANLDAAQFANPTRLDATRGAAGHLALGMGMHPCLGAALVRMAVASATTALLGATTQVDVVGQVEWLDGFAIRSPVTLPVCLRR